MPVADNPSTVEGAAAIIYRIDGYYCNHLAAVLLLRQGKRRAAVNSPYVLRGMTQYCSK